MICNPRQVDQIKKNICWAWGMYEGEGRCVQGFGGETRRKEKHEGKRILGRSRLRWEALKMDLKLRFDSYISLTDESCSRDSFTRYSKVRRSRKLNRLRTNEIIIIAFLHLAT